MATLLHDTITQVADSADTPSQLVELSDGVFFCWLKNGPTAPTNAGKITIQKEDPFNGDMDDVFVLECGKEINAKHQLTYRIPAAGKYWVLIGGNTGQDVTARAYVEQIM